jgi:Domain of unknown function (DUF5011)
MKKLINYLTVFLIALLWSCEPSLETEGISRITNYPVILLKGERWNQIPVGGSYTDPGVTALEGETPLTPTVTGTVNPAVAGVYTIQYDAVNKDGYSATEYRYVGVIAPAVTADDLTGTYQRNAGARGFSHVSKISGNLYFTDNVGGVAPADVDGGDGVYFYYYDTGKLGVPFQRNQVNQIRCTNATVILGVSYSWTVLSSAFGTAHRTFVKL